MPSSTNTLPGFPTKKSTRGEVPRRAFAIVRFASKLKRHVAQISTAECAKLRSNVYQLPGVLVRVMFLQGSQTAADHDRIGLHWGKLLHIEQGRRSTEWTAFCQVCAVVMKDA
jgi:hypothetical protein